MQSQFPTLRACRGVLGITVLSAVAVLPACSSPFDWDADVELRLVNPVFEEVVVTDVSGEDPLEFTVRAVPSEPFWFEQRDRVAVSVRSAGGEERDVHLRPTLCVLAEPRDGYPMGTRYFCDRFVIWVHADGQLETLRPRIEALPGTLVYNRLCSQSGECDPPHPRLASVRAEGDVFLAIRTAEWWPEVKEASLSTTARAIPGGVEDGMSSDLRGRLSSQQAHGEELELVYHQPDGSSLRASLVVP